MSLAPSADCHSWSAPVTSAATTAWAPTTPPFWPYAGTQNVCTGIAVTNISKSGTNMIANFLLDHYGEKGDADGNAVVNVMDVLFTVNIILQYEVPDDCAFWRANICEELNPSINIIMPASTPVIIIHSLILSNNNYI